MRRGRRPCSAAKAARAAFRAERRAQQDDHQHARDQHLDGREPPLLAQRPHIAPTIRTGADSPILVSTELTQYLCVTPWKSQSPKSLEDRGPGVSAMDSHATL